MKIPAFKKLLNVHMQEIIHGAFLAFLLRGLGAILSFLFTIALSRTLGAEGTGTYLLALAVSIIGSVIGRIGLDNSILRFISAHAVAGELGTVHSIHTIAFKLAIYACSIVTIVIFISADWIAGMFSNKEGVGSLIRWMSLTILPFAILNLQAETFKGLKKFPIAMYIQGISTPLIGLMLIIPLASIWDLTGAAWAYILAVTITAIIALISWRRISKKWPNEEAFPLSKFLNSSKHLFLVSLINRAILPWAPIFILGMWVEAEQVGIYGAASRIVVMMSFFLIAVNNIVAPKFSELYSQGEMKALGATARQIALFLTLLASPLLLILIFYGSWIMSIFGSEFVEGGFALAVLAIGQYVSVFCGSVGFLLMMSGNEKIYSQTVILSVIVQLVLTFILIPKWGMNGVAVATSISVIVLNLVSVFHVHRILGIQTIPILGWHKQ